MALRPGDRVGTYEIFAPLGAGGMGEVYRARDTKLRRDVAIKVLPPEFSSDADRLARFEREALMLASLNHPNIGAIYGLEHVDGVPALVLELIEGQTLADRLATGPLPLHDALTIAAQIALALEAAHDRGIVHRDLKPANIKITPDGIVKVLDFGLAKATASGAAAAVTQSPTVTVGGTHDGVILGTAPYMSPEQATGQPADARSDNWAFGVILFEMLSGKQGFVGATTVEVLSNVLKSDLDWAALPASTPQALRSLLRRCAQKDRSRRLRDIADARFQIEEALSEPAGAPAVTASTSPRSAGVRLLWIGAMLAVVAGAAGTAWYAGRRQVQSEELRVDVNAPPTIYPTSLAISPDGKMLVFAASSDGTSRLWVRSLDAVVPRPLAGTEEAKYPFWAPDGRSVGFSAGSQIKRVELESGSVRVVVTANVPLGGAWNRDGTILYDNGPGDSLYRVSADGGHPAEVTQSSDEAADAWSPQLLPDQRHFLFCATGTAPGIYIGQLGEPGARRRIVEAQAATYVSEHLLFVREGTLFAQAFDPARLEMSGSPTVIAEHVVVGPGPCEAALSASAAGPIVYRTGKAVSQFAWFDRSGKALGTVAGSEIGDGYNSSLSPDGRRLAVSSFAAAGTTDVWLLDLSRGVPTRFTFDPAYELMPVWSPDGSRIAFDSNRTGHFSVYVKPVAGAGGEQLLVAGDKNINPSDWSPDGRFVLLTSNSDIWALPLGGDRKMFPVVHSMFHEANGQFSPDSKWIAYQSDKSGRDEIYVQPFPGPGRETRISGEGGIQARWGHDGREIFYLASDNRLMAAPIRLDASTENVEVGTPVALFATHLSGTPRNYMGRHYTVSRDGRFLVDTLKEVTLPISVILNWKPRP